MSLAQYSVMARLLEEGEATPSDLAALERVAAPSMTRTVRCLEDAGYVTRAGHPSDGRAFGLHLTAAGRKLVRAAEQDVMQLELEASARLSADERQTLIGLLQKIYL